MTHEPRFWALKLPEESEDEGMDIETLWKMQGQVVRFGGAPYFVGAAEYTLKNGEEIRFLGLWSRENWEAEAEAEGLIEEAGDGYPREMRDDFQFCAHPESIEEE